MTEKEHLIRILTQALAAWTGWDAALQAALHECPGGDLPPEAEAVLTSLLSRARGMSQQALAELKRLRQLSIDRN